jgi:hypothetical protein
MHLSVAQFHARFVELTDRTRRTGCAACVWMPPCCSSNRERTEATALRCGYASASALAYALRRERGVTSRQLRSRAEPAPHFKRFSTDARPARA